MPMTTPFIYPFFELPQKKVIVFVSFSSIHSSIIIFIFFFSKNTGCFYRSKLMITLSLHKNNNHNLNFFFLEHFVVLELQKQKKQ